MKLNNKGVISSVFLYGLFILFIFLIVGIITLLSNRKMILDKIKKDVKDELNEMTKYQYYENGTAIYFNPVTGKLCGDYTEENSLNQNKTGCMKWYIFNDNINRSTVNMILDHNTTAKVAYETSGTYKEYEQASIKSTVDSDTAGWVGSPRLITANEIATITNTTTFDGSSSKWFYFNGTGNNKQTQASSSQGDNEYAWLFDYTNGCTDYGCNTADSSNYGYWTSSPVSVISIDAWGVGSYGSLVDLDVGDPSVFGVRPVITVNKKKLISPFKGTYVEPQQSDTHKGIVYLDPTDSTKTCTKELSDSNVNNYGKPTGINTGCMKFYIFDDSGDTYKMILDHNTSGSVSWINHDDYIEAGGTEEDWTAEKYNLQGPVTVTKRLEEDTEGWEGNPRFIRANEVAHIVGADSNDTIKWSQSKTYGTDDTSTKSSWFYLDGTGTTYSNSNGWQKQVATTPESSNYAWLYDYTYKCTGDSTEYGCKYVDNNQYPYETKNSLNEVYIFGYWTKDAVVGTNNYAWRIDRFGDLTTYDVSNVRICGVRPVIAMNKSYINKN